MAPKSRFIVISALVFAAAFAKAQAPAISYSSPQVYSEGVTITPLSPSNPGGAVPALTTTQVAYGFNNPKGVAIDASGNLYVADEANNAVYKIAAGTTSLVAIGSGFSQPDAVAADAAGNIYVADNGHSLIKKIPASGGPVLRVNKGLIHSTAIAVDASGNIYTVFGSTLQKILASSGSPVTISTAFTSLQGVAVDGAGNVYVADRGSESPYATATGKVYEIPVGGGAMTTVLSGIYFLNGLASDTAGNLFVSYLGNTVSRLPAGGGPIVDVASGFFESSAVAVNAHGELCIGALSGDDAVDDTYVVYTVNPGGYFISPSLPAGLSINTNTGVISGAPTQTSPAKNYAVTAYNSSGINTAVLNITVNPPPLPTVSYASPQVYATGSAIIPLSPTSANVGPIGVTVPATIATGLSSLFSVATDNFGNVYALENGPGIVVKIPKGGGSPVTIGSGFNLPTGVAVDAAGNVYVADNGNNAVKKIQAGGGAITVVGSGFKGPYGLAIDAAGNLYVGDAGHNEVKEIPAGSNTPIQIGSGFNHPTGVAVDGAGNVFVADRGNNEIKEILASNGNTLNIAATDLNTSSVAVDAAGNVYFNDINNNEIFKVPFGGSKISIGSGFSAPTSVAVDGAGVVYIADNGNEALKSITPAGGYYLNTSLPAGLSFNNNTGVISGTPTAVSPTTSYTVTAYNGGGSGTAGINIQVVEGNASLANLTLSAGTLTPAFDPTITNYAVTVSNALNTLTVTPTQSIAASTITVNGVVVASGTPSYAIPIPFGAKAIDVKVRTADDIATDYIITVTRPISSDATLSALTPSSGVVMPAFDPGTTSYTGRVTNGTTSVILVPVTDDPTATVTINGAAVLSNTQSNPIALSLGDNVITTVVTAQDGVTTKTYTLTISRDISGKAALSNLLLSRGSLSPAFDYLTTNYNAGVGNAVSSITVTPKAADITAVLTVNGATVASGTASDPITLGVGDNTITILVPSHGGLYSGSYTVTVTRAPGGADAYPGAIGVINPTAHPSFGDDILAVHQGISPNGDGVNDFLVIDGILAYPDNRLSIMNRNGELIYEAKGYDNSSKVFDGHSNKTGQMQLPGTYFYRLDYTVKGITQHKTGFIVLKY